MEYLQVAIRLLLVGLIDGPASVFAGAAGGRMISFDTSSPAGELAVHPNTTIVSIHLVPNRGPARGGKARIRKTLYMGALAASRHDPVIKGFYLLPSCGR